MDEIFKLILSLILSIPSPSIALGAFLPPKILGDIKAYTLSTNLLSKNDPARVINIASINGLTHPLMPTYSYSSSKSALIHLTRHLGADLAKYNININAIAPGFFPSKMTSHIAENESLSAQVIERIPIKRMGAPEDIAGTAIYLSSKASSWMCGETIVVDGGMVSASG